MTPALVIKLGGSHAGSALLRSWLDVVVASDNIVLVAGGGPFADIVRTMQPEIGYDDRAAHDMALMAMAQFGRALTALSDRLVYCDDLQSVLAATGRIPVWSPWPGLRDAADIPPSWDITSDSLAVWLACALDAPAVLLVKHRAAVEGLVDEGLVDRAFPTFAARYRGAIYIAGPEDMPAGRINPEDPPGRRVVQ